MAEVFGVVAGALGLVSVVKEIKNGINTLQQIRDKAGKVPSQIQSLTDDLEFLLIVLEELAKRHGPEHPILQHCKTCCDDVASRLTLLQEKIPRLQGSKLKQFKFAMRGLKVDLEDLHVSLTRAKANMSLAAAMPVLTVLETTQIQTLADESPKFLKNTPSTAVSSSLQARRPIRRGCWVGSMRRCLCSCHNTSTYSLGFLTMEYTPIRQKCDNETCDSWTFGSSVNLGLTSFGLSRPWPKTTRLLDITSHRVAMHTY
ncbi:hypothetical protein F5X68DRAFT_272982 [Plectosphaerella plurivora]|uniref:Uncharacterized protein n=1 Tax=Plectosphaerella plurivora TaxID=936078 RepID=A0A9P9AGL8_9PEZI|nr:hypothetical protein F5X68DRAFT_272982 [Plectosphaerella plurivora]